jgi:hypothetical protein
MKTISEATEIDGIFVDFSVSFEAASRNPFMWFLETVSGFWKPLRNSSNSFLFHRKALTLSTFEAIGKIWHISKHFHGRAKKKFKTFQANKIKLFNKTHKQPHERCTLKSCAFKKSNIS